MLLLNSTTFLFYSVADSIEVTMQNKQNQLRTNIHHTCQKNRKIPSSYTFGMQVDLILTDENHRVLYGEIPKCASSIWKKLMVLLSNRMTNFSLKNLTKLHNFKEHANKRWHTLKEAFLNIVHEQTYIKQVKMMERLVT